MMNFINKSTLSLVCAIGLLILSFQTSDVIQSELFKSLAFLFFFLAAHLFTNQNLQQDESKRSVKSH